MAAVPNQGRPLKKCPIGPNATGKSGKSGWIDWTSIYNN